MGLLPEGDDKSRFLSPGTERYGRVHRTQGVPVSNLGPRRPAVVTEVFRDLSQFLQANVGISPETRPTSLPSTYSPIYYSLIIITFDAI
jgi:hypothetical protein